MIDWNDEQIALIERYADTPVDKFFKYLPAHLHRYKCHECLHVVTENPCPNCENEDLIEMCPLDNCACTHDRVSGIAYCPICGKATCPICGSHDVAQISRVTGYLQEVNGWNAGKQQELKDRTRYDALSGKIVESPIKQSWRPNPCHKPLITDIPFSKKPLPEKWRGKIAEEVEA